MSNSAQTSASSRIAALLDENSFVEVGAYIAARNTDFNMTEQETPADGVVTGYGTIEGNLVYVYSQDASVLGGSIGEMHAKKIVNLYAAAMKTGAPARADFYFPKGQMGQRQGWQPRHRPPSPRETIHSLVTLTSAATQGSTKSKMVAPAYMTQPGRPMTGVPSS